MLEQILFATSNKGKCVEARKVAQECGVNLVTPDQLLEGSVNFSGESISLDPCPTVEETEDSYLGNAKLKAEAYFNWARIPALADDAGLEVDGLDGAPGVFSARYAGTGSFQDNIDKLLMELKKSSASRKAQFRTVLYLFVSPDLFFSTEGVLKGKISEEARGAGGFGYDSVFIVDGYGKTLAELKEQGISVKTHRILGLEKLFGNLADS